MTLEQISVLRAQVVRNLAILVVESNVENYSQMIEDDPSMSERGPFDEFGTDPETVSIILKDLTTEVAELAEVIQGHVMKGELMEIDYWTEQANQIIEAAT